jgi:predicted Zn-dependent protease
MTARSIRRGASREDWYHVLARLALAALVLFFIWLIVVSAAAAVEPPPRFPAPVFPGGKLPADFDPQKLFENLFGKAAGTLDNNDLLDQVDVSWDEEVSLGQQLLDDVKQRLAAQEKTLVNRGRDVEYVSQLVGLIQPQIKQAQRYRKLHVHVVNWGSPNAYAIPGGHLIISREMLDQAGCEAAIVCVLGHELAHLDRGHLLRRAKQWKLAQDQFAKPPTEFSFDKMMNKFSQMQQLFRLPFNPEQEAEADRDGITWAYHAGYDPRAVQRVYEVMEAAGLAAPDFLPAFLRTHPLTAERRESLRTTYAQLQADSPNDHLYLGRENLTRRLTRQQREFEE